MDLKWQRSTLDEVIEEFPEEMARIGPQHHMWKERIKMEIEKVMKYVNFLKSNNNRPWFRLYPDKNASLNYLIWRGELLVPEYPEIKFKIMLVLTSEYPLVCPRCFVESKIIEYSGKLYIKKYWRENDTDYVMICHEHIFDTNAWEYNLGIVHFFIRQVWVWWVAQQNTIIKEYERKNSEVDIL